MNPIRTSAIVALALLAIAPSPSLVVSGQEAAPAVRMVADEGEAAKHWARWRGPSGQGLVSGAGYPDSWSPTQNVVWKTALSGEGNSSPIVWGDRIFITTAYDNGRRVSLLAYRRTDGSKLWEAFAPEGRSSRGTHYKNGHASATPATDGQRVYVSFGARGLAAFDMDGKLVWHRDLGPMEAYHGTAGLAAALQGPDHPLSGSVRRVLHRRLRHAHGQGCVAHAARWQRRMGHADRRSRRRSRRDYRQQSAPRASLQPRHGR